jgi:ribosomal protein L11 methyltransferase
VPIADFGLPIADFRLRGMQFPRSGIQNPQSAIGNRQFLKRAMSGIRNSDWWLVTLAVSRDAEETASALFFELGSTGIVTIEETASAVTLGAYFDSGADTNRIKDGVEAGLTRAGCRNAIINLSITAVPEQDWMQKWKEGFEAVEIGERLIIAPSWKLPDEANGRVVIQIDPGMAFGTGTHETTRLCLEGIERCWRGGRLLDVGTGTGILAIAAAALVPGSRVVAIDIDPQAVEVARDNAAINGVSDSIEVFEGQPRELAGREFDVLVANLTAEVIMDLLGDLAACVVTQGLMILSGILGELAEDVERSLAASGLEVIERREAGEWSALVARRT